MNKRRRKKAMSKWVNGGARITRKEAAWIGRQFNSMTPFSVSWPEIMASVNKVVNTFCEYLTYWIKTIEEVLKECIARSEQEKTARG